MSQAIEISDLLVRRSGKTILDGITLRVLTGTVTGLLGPSGSGKTTLMRTIVGVQRIVAGTVRVLDRPAGHPALRREVGYTTQAASVYDDLNAIENVRYFAEFYRRARQDADIALAAVGLSKQADQLVRTMSSGERGRVSLACALVARPRLLVLDEPTVGLDPVLRKDLWQLFRGLAKEDGSTLLVSSHVMDEASRCDRLLLLREGLLVADDSPEELLAHTGASGLDEAFLRLIEREGARS